MAMDLSPVPCALAKTLLCSPSIFARWVWASCLRHIFKPSKPKQFWCQLSRGTSPQVSIELCILLSFDQWWPCEMGTKTWFCSNLYYWLSGKLEDRRDTEGSLKAILEHSPFKSEEQLMREFDCLANSRTGTRIIIYNLKRSVCTSVAPPQNIVHFGTTRTCCFANICCKVLENRTRYQTITRSRVCSRKAQIAFFVLGWWSW